MELTVHEDEKTETQRAVPELGFEPKSCDSTIYNSQVTEAT